MTTWKPGDLEDCGGWTAAQHADVAANLLDQMCQVGLSEPSDGTGPPSRHYGAGEIRVADMETWTDDTPLLAALVHVGLALYRSQRDGVPHQVRRAENR
jgi:hypothetical protein